MAPVHVLPGLSSDEVRTMSVVLVPGFLPSTHGFPYPNAWPHNPIREFRLGNVATLNIGDAANGLCGGMSFALADLFAAGRRAPGDPQPMAGTTRYDYIVERQIASFDNGRVPLRFYSLMSPNRPATEPTWAQLLGSIGVDRHSRAWTIARVEWPRIRDSLDRGRLAPIGLVRVVSSDPNELSRNHQVLAYGYETSGTTVVLRICDPNYARDDGVTISFDTASAGGQIQPAWSRNDARPVCFFLAPYQAADPVPFR
jgi:hypothetical protein